MIVIIAGSRDICGLASLRYVEKAMSRIRANPTEIVSGGASGIDFLGEVWAKNHAVPVRRFPADWLKHGRRAGFIRNSAMVQYAKKHKGALVAVWDGVSNGTRDTISKAREAGLKVFVLIVRKVSV